MQVYMGLMNKKPTWKRRVMDIINCEEGAKQLHNK